jgi:hypothetical protein
MPSPAQQTRNADALATLQAHISPWMQDVLR